MRFVLTVDPAACDNWALRNESQLRDLTLLDAALVFCVFRWTGLPFTIRRQRDEVGA